MTPKKILKNHKLVYYLMSHKHISQVSVDKDWICAVCSSKFLPSEVQEIINAVGYLPKITSKNGQNFIIFKR